MKVCMYVDTVGLCLKSITISQFYFKRTHTTLPKFQNIKFDDIKLGEMYTVTVKSVKTMQLNVQLSRKVRSRDLLKHEMRVMQPRIGILTRAS